MTPPPNSSRADGDAGAVHAVNAAAFGRADEARLVEALRARATPLVSLVAEEDGRIAGLARCAEIGAVAVVVLGHPTYYPRFGFVPAARFGLRCEYEVPDEAFMALELRPGALQGASGTVRYHPAFAGA